MSWIGFLTKRFANIGFIQVLTNLAIVAYVRTQVDLPPDRKVVPSMPAPFRSMLAALLIIFLTFTIGCGQGPAATSRDISLGVVYYLGYGWDVSGPPWNPIGGRGSQGWIEVKWDIIWSGLVTTVPEIGFYASGDPDIIETHLLLMESLGVDFVILPYQGWGDADLDGELDHPSYIGARVHDAAQLVLDTANRLELDMQFAFMVEPFMEHFSGGKLEPERVTDAQRQDILDRMRDDFYSPYADQMYQVDGLPLIAAPERFTWGPYRHSGGRYSQRNVVWHQKLGPSEDWAWVAVDRPPSGVFEDGTIFVWPRYDEFGVWLSHRPDMENRPLDAVLRMDPFLT